jgi:predicted DNA-binding transcriptional regulator AlpA
MGSRSVEEWCRDNGFSRNFFYLLVARNQAPRSFKIGRCRRISDAAHAEWLVERERESAAA